VTRDKYRPIVVVVVFNTMFCNVSFQLIIRDRKVVTPMSCDTVSETLSAADLIDYDLHYVVM